MIIKIGTLVLCHLMSPVAQNQQDEVRKIQKIPGIVKEIVESDDIEMFEDSYAVKKKKYFLVVEPKEKDKIFKIGSDACRPVISESEHVSIVKEKIKNKKQPIQNDLKSESKEINPQQEQPQLNDEKKELLKQLENN